MNQKRLYIFLPAVLGGGLFASSNLQQQVDLDLLHFPLLISAVIAGFFATVVMSLVMIFFQVITKKLMSIPLMLGGMILRNGSENDKRTIGTMMHLMVGSAWGFLFGVSFERGLFLENIILSGLLFGLILWFLMMIMLLPMMKKGFFGLKIDRGLWLYALIAHVAFGVFLGFLFPLL